MPQARADPKEVSPNPKIDRAIQAALARLESPDPAKMAPLDDVARIINVAIAWEKVKHHIKDDGAGYDPDAL